MRQQQAVALRVAGATYDQIAKATNASTMQAWRDVRKAMAATVAQRERDSETLVTLELDRLDAILRAMTPRARDGNTQAAAVCVRVSESRRRLLGLDAAERVELTGKGGGPVVSEHRPYEHLSADELFTRIERVRETLREHIDAEKLRAMEANRPLVPTFEETPEMRYAAVLAERARNRRTN